MLTLNGLQKKTWTDSGNKTTFELFLNFMLNVSNFTTMVPNAFAPPQKVHLYDIAPTAVN